jgi:hypothetical protein
MSLGGFETECMNRADREENMKLIVLGTDHYLQPSDPGLKQCVDALVAADCVTLIGEEYTPMSVAHQVAESKGIQWIQIDMTEEERNRAGIGDLLLRKFRHRANNFIDDEIAIYSPKGDGVREEYWLRKIEHQGDHVTALLICGACHLRPVTTKAQARGHQVSHHFYPETLSGLQVCALPETD